MERISDDTLALGNCNYYNKTRVIFVMIKGTVTTNDIISEELSLNQTQVNIHSNIHLLSSYYTLTAYLLVSFNPYNDLTKYHFTDEETGAEPLRDLFKVTLPGKGFFCLGPECVSF